LTDPPAAAASSTPIKKRYTKHKRRHIDIGDDVLIPRAEMAELIGCTERTLQKLRVPVTTISNVAYLAKNAALAAYVAAHTRHPPEPVQAKRRRRR
jgi:hypothetical protein